MMKESRYKMSHRLYNADISTVSYRLLRVSTQITVCRQSRTVTHSVKDAWEHFFLVNRHCIGGAILYRTGKLAAVVFPAMRHS